jgi:vacuolar-type H+-ATPase subunit F/Vma7
MMREGSGKQWPLINPKKLQKKKDYKDSGIVILSMFEASKTSTFLDFVTAGLQIGITIAIDFTGSNGRVTSPFSLHHVGGKEPNAYLQAIEAVGNVLQEYDSDKIFPVYGFGARIPPNMEVSHAFPINFKTNTPHCNGVRGVIDAYKTSLSHLELFGPTNFAPIINQVAKFAAAAQVERSARNYFVLLILTDGVITDLDDTVRSIVAASHLPMSIIIVGIGGSDFEPLEVLESEMEDKASGSKIRRDIVQLVAYRDCETSEELAKRVLAEVPKQVCEYYSMYNIQPGQGVRR